MALRVVLFLNPPSTYRRRVGAAGYRNCSNPAPLKALRDQNRGSLWGLIWREHTLDFIAGDGAETIVRQTAKPAFRVLEIRPPLNHRKRAQPRNRRCPRSAHRGLHAGSGKTNGKQMRQPYQGYL